MISANEPFFGGALVAAFGSFGGGVGWPFLKLEDAVEVWMDDVRLLAGGALSFILAIDVSTPPGLLFVFKGREVFAGLEEVVVVFWSLSAGRRRASPSDDLRFGGNKGRFEVVGLGSPEIDARRSPICEFGQYNP